VQVRQGKGPKERELPLNASVRRALRAYLQLRPEVQLGDPLFLSDRNRALSPRAAQRLVQALRRRAKIARLRVTPHLLRHTFALNYLRQNPGKLVQLAEVGEDHPRSTLLQLKEYPPEATAATILSYLEQYSLLRSLRV
jgi:site-specific recombinase XerD